MTDIKLDLSVVIPVHNSARTLFELVERLEKVLKEIVNNKYELVFVNDGSTDSSWNILKELAESNDKIIAINLTRNFGQHNALMCGFAWTHGKYIITLDDDLQNPPEEIPKLFNEIQNGYDVVYGIYDTKKHTKFKNLGSEIVQQMYRKTFNINLRISSFRIIGWDTIQRILVYERSFTFIDGIICWFTTNIGNVMVEHHQRKFGTSGYSVMKLLTLAINMMANFSIVPLRAASLSGILFSGVGFLFGTYILTKKLLFDIPVSGFASTIVSITMLSGVQLLTVGIVGEYLGRVHMNISRKPQYSTKEIIRSGEVADE